MYYIKINFYKFYKTMGNSNFNIFEIEMPKNQWIWKHKDYPNIFFRIKNNDKKKIILNSFLSLFL